MTEMEYSPVVSSRIQLSRNLKDHIFPTHMDLEEKNAVLEEIIVPIVEDPKWSSKFDVNILETISDNYKQELLEKQIITSAMLKDAKGNAVLYNPKKSLSVMINEEDHIKIQSVKEGLNIYEAYNDALEIDKMFSEDIEYARDEKHGYLTSSLTTVGTGLKVSVMVHIPGTIMVGEFNNMVTELKKMGIKVNGIYGVGIAGIGNMFQISNIVTFAEEDIILKQIDDAAKLIAQREKASRRKILETDKIVITDKIFRAFGVLKNARLMSYKEAMRCFSDIIFGIDMNLIQGIDVQRIREIAESILPSMIQKNIEKKISIKEIDFKRAEIIRNTLA